MRKGKVLLIAAFLLASAGAVVLHSEQWGSYHDFKGRCLECHIAVPTPGGDPPRAFTRDIGRMCGGCHGTEQELSHPVGMKPSMKVPEGFPLDWKGEVTCATCHPVHEEGHGDFRLRSRASGQGFCVMCHSDLESELHKLSVGAAHVGGSASKRQLSDVVGAELDELSIKCLACHDAITGGDALVENLSLKRGLFHNNNNIGLSHPIGVSYIEARRNYKGAYRPVEKLPKQIRLFNGTVGCASCHNPYSKLHNELVMSNERSALCLACHVK